MQTKKIFSLLFLIGGILMIISSCSKTDYDKKAEIFIKNIERKVKPIEKKASLSYWKAATTGKNNFYSEYEGYTKKLADIYSNKDNFKTLKEIRERGKITEPEIKRELDILYLNFLKNQIPKSLRDEIIILETRIEREFSKYRPKVDGKEITINKIYEILKKSNNSEERKKYWLASKEVGEIVIGDFLKLVKMRNKAARDLGFKNYYIMALETSEQTEEDILAIFDEVDNKTKDIYKKLKAEIDLKLSKKFNISPDEIMPWHYDDPYFQEGLSIFEQNTDYLFKGKDIIKIADNFYKSIGIDLKDIIKRSDFYEKKGKNPHAFEIMIGRDGDVRVLMNIKDNSQWMETALHEFGHAAYSKYINKNLPYFLKEEAHIFVTEAIAMLFGRLSKNPKWLKKALELSDKQIKELTPLMIKNFLASQLIFSRWAQVMMRFERELYYNPDQDLNTLWWKLKGKYQLMKKPENRNKPDFAAKIHIVTDPVYYHNYLLGEILASQLNNYIITHIYKKTGTLIVPYYGKKEIGKFLIDKIFKYGARYRWDKLIQLSTEEELTPHYYTDMFFLLN